MSHNLNPCGFCRCPELGFEDYDRAIEPAVVAVVCNGCGASGPAAAGEPAAAAAWNAAGEALVAGARTATTHAAHALLTALVEDFQDEISDDLLDRLDRLRDRLHRGDADLEAALDADGPQALHALAVAPRACRACRATTATAPRGVWLEWDLCPCAGEAHADRAGVAQAA